MEVVKMKPPRRTTLQTDHVGLKLARLKMGESLEIGTDLHRLQIYAKLLTGFSGREFRAFAKGDKTYIGLVS